MPQKVLIALPPAMLEQVDFIAGVEHRTRSDLIREALRRYLDNFKRSQVPRTATDSVSFAMRPPSVTTELLEDCPWETGKRLAQQGMES